MLNKTFIYFIFCIFCFGEGFTFASTEKKAIQAESVSEEIYIASFFPRPSPFSQSRLKNRLNKKKIFRKANALTEDNYQLFLEKIKGLIAPLNEMNKHPDHYKELLIFWQLGEQISQEKTIYKGNKNYIVFLIDNLSKDINISKDNLHNIEKFYILYSVVATLSLQLNWLHYEILIEIGDEAERKFYQRLAVEKKWTREELAEKIKQHLYEKNTSFGYGQNIYI